MRSWLTTSNRSFTSKPRFAADFSDREDLAMRGMGESAYPGNRKILSEQQAPSIAKPKSI